MGPLLGVLGQVDTVDDSIVMPSVDWWAVAPVVILVAGAFVILVLASLLRRRRGVIDSITWLGIGTTLVAAGSVWLPSWIADEVSWINPQWETIRRRGPFSAIADSVNVDGFAVFLTLVICAAVVLSLLVLRSFARREGWSAPRCPCSSCCRLPAA